MTKTALIAGATGLTGRSLTALLLDSPEYTTVYILVRTPVSASHPKLHVIVHDFDDPLAPLPEAHTVFCCLGTTIKKAGSREAFRKVDFEYPLRLAAQALKNGACQFLVVTALGANPRSVFFYNRVKGMLEAQLKQLPYPTLHILRPSLLLGNRPEKRAGESAAALFMKVLSPFLRGPLKKYRAIPASRVAFAMYSLANLEQPGTFVHDSGDLWAYRSENPAE